VSFSLPILRFGVESLVYFIVGQLVFLVQTGGVFFSK
jgi:hypothetical protein